MFTGIIEALGSLEKIIIDRSNVDFIITSKISKELKIDQSVAHEGVCLTVVEQNEHWHRVESCTYPPRLHD